MRCVFLISIAMAALSGCSVFEKSKPNPLLQAYGSSRTVRDIPMMPDTKVDLKASLIIGPSEGWMGRLVLSTSQDINFTCNYMLAEMPKLGWQPIAAIRAKISLLTFKRDGRVATIQIDEGALRGGGIVINVTPETSPAAWDAGASNGEISPSYSNQGYEVSAPVETQTLGALER